MDSPFCTGSQNNWPVFLAQVRLSTEVLCTSSSTQPGFELMTSISWHYISCLYGACSNHSAISNCCVQAIFFRKAVKHLICCERRTKCIPTHLDMAGLWWAPIIQLHAINCFPDTWSMWKESWLRFMAARQNLYVMGTWHIISDCISWVTSLWFMVTVKAFVWKTELHSVVYILFSCKIYTQSTCNIFLLHWYLSSVLTLTVPVTTIDALRHFEIG